MFFFPTYTFTALLPPASVISSTFFRVSNSIYISSLYDSSGPSKAIKEEHDFLLAKQQTHQTNQQYTRHDDEQ